MYETNKLIIAEDGLVELVLRHAQGRPSLVLLFN